MGFNGESRVFTVKNNIEALVSPLLQFDCKFNKLECESQFEKCLRDQIGNHIKNLKPIEFLMRFCP